MLNKFKIRYDIYNSLVRTVEDTIVTVDFSKPFFTRFFDDDDVPRRCKQALLTLIMPDFIMQCLKSRNPQDLRTGSYSLINGQFNFRFPEKLKITLWFTGGNILVLFYLLQSFFFRKKDVGNNAILHCYGRESLYESSNYVAATEFLTKGPFHFINDSRLYLGINRPIRSKDFGHSLSKYPLLELLKSTRFTVLEALKLVVHIVENYFCFLWYAFRSPIFFLLYSDFLWLPMMNSLSRKRELKHYIFDNSDFSKQILPIVSLKGRNFTTHMIFYACNTKGFKYKQVDEVAEHPHYQFMKLDKAWVWNDSSKNWLQKNSPLVGSVSVVGDVLFYVDNKKTIDLEGAYKILVFDVTPASKVWRDSFAGGSVGFDFYSPEHMCKFIEGVEASVQELGSEVKVFIKPKRIPSEKWHDKKYVELLKSSKRMHLLDPDLNIYEVVRGVDLVLAVPFTSALHIAEKLKVPSIYYDPTGALEFSGEYAGNNIEFVQSQESLRQKVESHYTEKLSHPQ